MFECEEEKISVVIPAYNAEDTIERAVASVYDQSYKNIELIVVNDGSLDKTGEVLESLQKKYTGMLVINKENGGVSSARNAGIMAAGGELLITLDDDDYIDKDMLFNMYHRLKLDKSDTVICGFRNVYQDGRKEDFSPAVEGVYDRKAFVNGPLLQLYDKRLISTHSNKLYKLDIIRREGIYYEPGRQINEDILFCIKYLEKCKCISVVKEVYMNYVQHGYGESLINSFHEDGITSCFPVLEAMGQLINGYAAHDISNQLNIRMLFHILSFNGLMYRNSGYSPKLKLNMLKEFAERSEFRALLYAVRPEDMKTKVAHTLLKHKMYRAYHYLCCILYRERR